ncbi:MAG: AbrB/MazE/SpoVT family DNA-binding domain-containing protein [Spirochaetaceae bacterium]|nr:MAG: AbrB/MazE/SpoVT family DNA-binding domain-containing protein [Spirochaetaceae bacterium]
MQITIDRSGRIVVPKQVRDRFHLIAGTALELEVESDGIRIRPVDQEPSLLRKQGVLIHHGPEPVDLDIAGFVNRDRSNRDSDLVAEEPPE